jgi:hypothetical protein
LRFGGYFWEIPTKRTLLRKLLSSRLLRASSGVVGSLEEPSVRWEMRKREIHFKNGVPASSFWSLLFVFQIIHNLERKFE